jgi:hypothetical protein
MKTAPAASWRGEPMAMSATPSLVASLIAVMARPKPMSAPAAVQRSVPVLPLKSWTRPTADPPPGAPMARSSSAPSALMSPTLTTVRPKPATSPPVWASMVLMR